MDPVTERLARTYSGAVYDVLRGRGLDRTVLPHSIVPLDPTMRLAGPIFTMRGRPAPGSNGHETLLRWTEFLARAPAGHVVVCEGNDDTRALMGELSAEALKTRGVLGYITDGGCRDCRFIIDLGLPVFSRFRTPRDVVGAWMPEAFDVPITVGEVGIAPGDYVLADIDGIVAIPSAMAASVADEVDQVMQTENKVRSAILGGMDPRNAYLKYGKF